MQNTQVHKSSMSQEHVGITPECPRKHFIFCGNVSTTMAHMSVRLKHAVGKIKAIGWNSQNIQNLKNCAHFHSFTFTLPLITPEAAPHTPRKQERSRWPVSCSHEQDSPIFPPHSNAKRPTQQQRNTAGREDFIDLFCMLNRACSCTNKQHFASLLFQPKSRP